jgi:hypothetical protein
MRDATPPSENVQRAHGQSGGGLGPTFMAPLSLILDIAKSQAQE